MTESPLHHVRRWRLLPTAVERAMNSAFSSGPGYEATPIGTAFDDRSVRGYYIDFRSKTSISRSTDRVHVPSVALIQQALGWWERSVAGEARAREEFLRLCGLVEARAESVRDEMRWPVRVSVPKYELSPPWPSALVQGQAVSVFVRAHLVTAQDQYAELAKAAARPLLGPGPSSLVVHTEAGPILEEAPSDPPSHILNGWISAAWGLWDLHLGIGDTRAGQMFDETIRSLRSMLPAYDTGWWSLYALYPHRVPDLAKPIYHRFHVSQLEVLHRLTGFSDVKDVARRWMQYDRSIQRARALFHKGVFVALDTPRRRRWESQRVPP